MLSNGKLFTIECHLQSIDNWQCHVRINAASPLIQDHKVNQLVIVSGAFWLECITSVVSHVMEDEYQICGLVWIAPYVIDQSEASVEIIVTKKSDLLNVFVNSYISGVNVTHIKATMRRRTEPTVTNKRLPINSLKERSESTIEHDEIYNLFSDIGFNYGKSYRLISRSYCSSKCCLSELIDTASTGHDYTYYHPGIIDAALQSCLGMSYVGKVDDAAHLPFSIKGIKHFLSSTKIRYVYALTNQVTTQSKSYHLMFLDINGDVLTYIHEFIGRRQVLI